MAWDDKKAMELFDATHAQRKKYTVRAGQWFKRLTEMKNPPRPRNRRRGK